MKILDRMKSVIKTEEIEFLCEEIDHNVIPEPYPARKLMPDWFKNLPPKIGKENKLTNSTIKRCPPFLDAMTLGWIIPLAADIEIVTNNDASGLNFKSLFYKPILESHNHQQLNPPGGPNHPTFPKPPMKFLNYWLIKVPKDYSVLFVPPLNRPDTRFQCISGMVDCDGYFEYINFPFTFNIPNYTGIIKAGTPLVQVIPIKRETLLTKHNTRVFEKEELDERELTRRKRASHESHYRDNIWHKRSTE